MSGQTVLVIGRSGQVASALDRLNGVSPLVYRCCGRGEADLTDGDSLRRALGRHAPALVVNAAAFTAVDQAEQAREAAFAVNAEGPALLAQACHAAGVPLIHVSTDYVFDGEARTPYRVDHPLAPLGVYGASKAAGEAAVRARLERHLIVRTAWVYDERGRNFLTTMLRLGAERDRLRIVDDQVGAPTYAADIAAGLDAMARVLLRDGAAAPWGTCHLTSAGSTTWYGFAREIFRLAALYGRHTPAIEPIATADYPTPARRPAYSVLDLAPTTQRFGVTLPDWRDGVRRCMAAIFAGGEAVAAKTGNGAS